MTISEYIRDSSDIRQRYDRICLIIQGLEESMLTNIDNNGVVQYSLDDGQTKINTTYRSVKELSETIEALDKIRARLHATLTGTRIVRLCDAEAVQSNYLRRR